jgi:hypothetical protein
MSPTISQVDLSHLTQEDLINLRRHLRAMLILVDQLLRFPLTVQREPDRRSF